MTTVVAATSIVAEFRTEDRRQGSVFAEEAALARATLQGEGGRGKVFSYPGGIAVLAREGPVVALGMQGV